MSSRLLLFVHVLAQFLPRVLATLQLLKRAGDRALWTRKEYDDALSYIHVNPAQRGSRRMIAAVLILFIFLLWP